MAGMTNSITDYIGIVKVDGTEYLTGSTLFGTCTTDANEAAKKVVIEEITNFTPTHGLTIHVLFTHTNTAASPTLQFSPESTATTYPIYAYGNSPVGNTLSTSWHDNAIVSFTFYDGALDQTATAKRWIMNSGTDTGADGLAAVNLVNVNNADDLKAIEALTKANGYLKKTAANTWTLVDDQEASSTVAGITKIGASGGAATYEHTHGNITNSGALQTSDVTIGNGDKLVITDSSDGNKVARASLSFGANNATNKGKALTQAGTWESFTNNLGTVTSITPGAGLVKGNTTSTDTTAITDSGTISIKQGGVTNDMLAGSIAPAKLADNATIGIGSQSIKVGGAFDTDKLLKDLSLSNAMHYKGEVTEIPPASGTYVAGDVVTLKDTAQEHVYDGTNWRELGSEASYKFVQTAVSDPTPSDTTATTFIATIEQNTQGVITATKKTVPVQSVAGLTGAITTADLKSQLALNNVTNYAQIEKRIGTTKGDIIYFTKSATPTRLGIGTEGQVLTVKSDGTPDWADNQATDNKVAQTPLVQDDGNANKEYAILFKNTHSAWTEETAGVKFTSTNDYRVTINPSTGTLTARNLVGTLRAEDVKTALNASDTANSSIIFLHKSGNWKTISVGVGTANANGNVVTNVTQSAGTKPNFTEGTLATASVSNGVLTLVSATADTFNAGAFPTLTVTKANVTISAANT